MFLLKLIRYWQRQESVGGAEVQQVLIAKEIRRYGFNISFVVGDYGQKAIETINNMIVIRSFRNFYNSKLYRVLRSKMEKDARSYVEREHNVIKNGSCLVAIIDRL